MSAPPRALALRSAASPARRRSRQLGAAPPILSGALAAALAAAPCAAAPTLADPPPVKLVQGDVALEYLRDPDIAAACPDEAQLRDRAADAFELHDPFVPPGATASGQLHIHITRESRRYHASIVVLDAAGRSGGSTWEEHVDCDALVWVLAHRAALAILRKSSRSTLPPPPDRPPPPPDPPPPPPPAACDPRCLADLARRMQTERVKLAPYSPVLSAGGLMALGLTPEPAPGLWLGLALRWGWFSLDAEARGSFRAGVTTFAPGLRSELSWITGLFAPCLRWRVFRGCVLIEAGVIEHQLPTGTPSSGTSLVALGPRVGLDVPLARGFLFRASGDLTFHPLISRISVRLGPEDDAPISTWELPVVGGILSAGLAWSG